MAGASPLAHAEWFDRAAASEDADAAKHRDAVAELMTPAQIVAAQKLAREWMRKSERP